MERAEEVGREGAPGASALAPAGTHGAAEPGGAGNSCGGVLGCSAALLRDLRRAGEGRAGEESGRAGGKGRGARSCGGGGGGRPHPGGPALE